MSMVNMEIEVRQDCEGTRIPSGERVQLRAGEAYVVTQALGGSVTLRGNSGLVRVAPEAVDALGPEVAAAARAVAAQVAATEGEFGEAQVWEALRQCFDPEIPVNIVDLGLIYDLRIEPIAEGGHHVEVKMTLTATGCGMGPTIAADAREKIERLAAVRSANVEIVWDPQWTPHMISEEGRKILGLD